MKNRKVLMIFLIGVLVLFSTVNANIGSPPKLTFNGDSIEVDTKLINNQVYVKLDTLAKAIGGNTVLNTQKNTMDISLMDVDYIIPRVIESVSPSVVGIIGTYSYINAEYGVRADQNFIHGTGAIISANGEIITNAHVVEKMEKIIVVLADGNAYEAKLKAIDLESDLAIITINKTGLKPVKFAKESDVNIGNTVIAIGTPISFSLRNSASMGIISGINRGLESYYRVIQTDAAINPGNSGGPLVNLKGEIVGINSNKYMGEGIEGMGFSIPVNTIEYVLAQFYKYGKVVRPYLGVKFEENWISKVGLPSNNGITVYHVEPKSPASTYGLKASDILLSINDIKINSIVDYNEAMKKYEPNSKATFKIKRNGIIQNLNVTFGEKK
jgi:serine protease Do